VSGNLPDFPVNSIKIDPVIHNTWYAGTDGGVFITRNGGDIWEIFGVGLPRVPVLDLNLHNPSRMLTAATFGRSMYKIPLPAAESNSEPMVQPLKISTFPNPFSEELTISVTVEGSVHGELSVFDLHGKLITKIHHGQLVSGDHHFTWNGRSANGQYTSSGLYFIRLVTNELNATLKINKL
jgi:hypothetical protein